MAEPIDTLKRIHLFDGLSEDELALVAAKLSRESFSPGTAIIQQGASGARMFILLEGRARVLRKLGEAQVLITELEHPQSFGEMGIIDGELASATVEAEGSLTALALSRDDFEALVASSASLEAKLWRNLAKELTRRIRLTTNQVQDYFAINQSLCENDKFREFYKLYGP
ncbi:MAG: cyclic nucleotide-binding domain-containing protein [Acidobacteria bacterium]|jgi:CRP-like cAMP-binding protein|nr:cyclic nucleotide-binding domain-containing protein [Acidobacteriota bacterium]